MPDLPQERILILAPIPQDAMAMATLLQSHGFIAMVCEDSRDVCNQLEQGAAALLATEEAQGLPNFPALLQKLKSQPAWSELPLIILTYGGESRWAQLLNVAADAAGSITLLERPIGQITLLRSIEVALRARRRQYQVRDLLKEQHAIRTRLVRFSEELERKVSERTHELMVSQRRLRALARELNLTEQRERKRLAAELHDHLQQLLVVAKLKLGQAVRTTASHPTWMNVIQETEEVLADALKYTRTLVAELSPPVLRDHGLPAALKWIGEYMNKHNLVVDVTVTEDNVALPEEQATLIFQSVRELLVNSAKYAGTGRAAVLLEKRHDHLRIEVSDQGAGFDMATVALDRPNEDSSKFGFFSIRERMKSLGGSFELHSAVGKGTKAALLIPLDDQTVSRKDEHSPTIAAGERRIPQSEVMQVLLVDDHAMLRQGLRSILDAYEDVKVVGEARNGQEAVQAVDQLKPSVVVMDINMPTMNGIEATAMIKSRHPEAIIIGLSINDRGQDQEAMVKAGASRLLSKEAAIDHLYQTIHDIAKNGTRHEANGQHA